MVGQTAVADPVVRRFRAVLDEIYGGRIERVVLFGSRARGDAESDSDYDVAVFLRDLTDRPVELSRLAEAETDILYDTGAVINALAFHRALTGSAPALCMSCVATDSIYDASTGRYPGRPWVPAGACPRAGQRSDPWAGKMKASSILETPHRMAEILK